MFLSRKISKLLLLLGTYTWMIEIARKEGSLVLMIREQYFCRTGRLVLYHAFADACFEDCSILKLSVDEEV